MTDFFAKLDELFQAGDPVEIERFLTGIVRDMEREGRGHSAECASVYNELACFYRGISRYVDSAGSFESALSLLEALGMNNTPQYATVVLNYAGLLRLKGDTAGAIREFLRAKALLEAAEPRDEYAYASVLNNLSLAYHEAGELQAAFSAASAALEYMRSSTSSEHEIATSLNNLAALQIELGDLDAAQRLAAEALEMYDHMPQPNVHHAAALGTMAAIRYRNGEMEKAAQAYLQSLSLTEHFFGKNIDYAVIEQNLSRIYESMGDFGKAHSHMASASSLFCAILGAGHDRSAETLRETARLKTLAEAGERS